MLGDVLSVLSFGNVVGDGVGGGAGHGRGDDDEESQWHRLPYPSQSQQFWGRAKNHDQFNCWCSSPFCFDHEHKSPLDVFRVMIRGGSRMVFGLIFQWFKKLFLN